MLRIKSLLSKILRRNSEKFETEDEQIQKEDWGIQMAQLYADELRENTEYWEIKKDTDKKRYK